MSAASGCSDVAVSGGAASGSAIARTAASEPAALMWSLCVCMRGESDKTQLGTHAPVAEALLALAPVSFRCSGARCTVHGCLRARTGGAGHDVGYEACGISRVIRPRRGTKQLADVVQGRRNGTAPRLPRARQQSAVQASQVHLCRAARCLRQGLGFEARRLLRKGLLRLYARGGAAAAAEGVNIHEAVLILRWGNRPH